MGRIGSSAVRIIKWGLIAAGAALVGRLLYGFCCLIYLLWLAVDRLMLGLCRLISS